MDEIKSSKFISSLSEFLQFLCTKYVNFEKTTKLTGQLYLSVDSGEDIQFSVNEDISLRESRPFYVFDKSSVDANICSDKDKEPYDIKTKSRPDGKSSVDVNRDSKQGSSGNNTVIRHNKRKYNETDLSTELFNDYEREIQSISADTDRCIQSEQKTSQVDAERSDTCTSIRAENNDIRILNVMSGTQAEPSFQQICKNHSNSQEQNPINISLTDIKKEISTVQICDDGDCTLKHAGNTETLPLLNSSTSCQFTHTSYDVDVKMEIGMFHVQSDNMSSSENINIRSDVLKDAPTPKNMLPSKESNLPSLKSKSNGNQLPCDLSNADMLNTSMQKYSEDIDSGDIYNEDEDHAEQPIDIEITPTLGETLLSTEVQMEGGGNIFVSLHRM